MPAETATEQQNQESSVMFASQSGCESQLFYEEQEQHLTHCCDTSLEDHNLCPSCRLTADTLAFLNSCKLTN